MTNTMAISERMYYRLSLMLPLGVLYVATGLLDLGELTSGVRQVITIFAIVPYAFFAMGLAAWSLDKPARRIRRALELSPLLFVVPVVAVAYPVLLLVFRTGLGEAVLVLGTTTLAVGYVSVAIAFGLLVLCRALGIVRSEP